MPLTVRLDDNLERKLVAFSRCHARSKSDVIKSSLREYLSKNQGDERPYNLGRDLFGKEGSSHRHLSTARKGYLKKKIHAKNVN